MGQPTSLTEAEAQPSQGSGASHVEIRSCHVEIFGDSYEDPVDAVLNAERKDYEAEVGLGPDSRTDAALSRLDPSIREQARQQIQELRAIGIDARVGRATITTAEQAKTYDDVKARFGPNGSAAPPGRSVHEIGKAYDIQLWEKGASAPIDSNQHPWYSIAGRLGLDLGLQWGVTKDIPMIDSVGVWHPTSWRDYRHFQVPHDQL